MTNKKSIHLEVHFSTEKNITEDDVAVLLMQDLRDADSDGWVVVSPLYQVPAKEEEQLKKEAEDLYSFEPGNEDAFCQRQIARREAYVDVSRQYISRIRDLQEKLADKDMLLNACKDANNELKQRLDEAKAHANALIQVRDALHECLKTETNNHIHCANVANELQEYLVQLRDGYIGIFSPKMKKIVDDALDNCKASFSAQHMVPHDFKLLAALLSKLRVELGNRKYNIVPGHIHDSVYLGVYGENGKIEKEGTFIDLEIAVKSLNA